MLLVRKHSSGRYVAVLIGRLSRGLWAWWHLCGEAKENSFHHIGASVAAPRVRLLDASGVAANVGLLQVRLQSSQNAEFGSVCGMNLVRAIY